MISVPALSFYVNLKGTSLSLALALFVTCFLSVSLSDSLSLFVLKLENRVALANFEIHKMTNRRSNNNNIHKFILDIHEGMRIKGI